MKGNKHLFGIQQNCNLRKTDSGRSPNGVPPAPPPPPPLQESGSGFLQEKREEDEVSCIKEEFIGAG